MDPRQIELEICRRANSLPIAIKKLHGHDLLRVSYSLRTVFGLTHKEVYKVINGINGEIA